MLRLCLILYLLFITVKAKVEVRFCKDIEDAKSELGLSKTPHHESKEIWDKWSLEDDKFNVNWHPSSDVCNSNVTSYTVSLRTNVYFVNKLLQVIGGFPQNLCDIKPKLLGYTNTNGTVPVPCSPYNCEQSWRQ